MAARLKMSSLFIARQTRAASSFGVRPPRLSRTLREANMGVDDRGTMSATVCRDNTRLATGARRGGDKSGPPPDAKTERRRPCRHGRESDGLPLSRCARLLSLQADFTR